MLLSMTGFGSARGDSGLSIDVRAVNNRHLKVTVRGGEQFQLLEAEFEKVVRRFVRRGTLLVQVRGERAETAGGASLNTAVLKRYLDQIFGELKGVSGADRSALLSGVLALPGVAPESAAPDAADWPEIEAVLAAALENLNAARRREGEAMAAELRKLADGISGELERVRLHLPGIMATYRQRLLDRVRQAVADAGVTVEPEQVIREVALFADRSDVAEELTRLSGHLDAFREMLDATGESPGRRLEFVVQEMGREANTLGSKAGDVTVSRHAIEIKAALERIRELVQNVE